MGVQWGSKIARIWVDQQGQTRTSKDVNLADFLRSLRKRTQHWLVGHLIPNPGLVSSNLAGDAKLRHCEGYKNTGERVTGGRTSQRPEQDIDRT